MIRPNDIVLYNHPDWGRVRGRVIRIEPNDLRNGRLEALCQDLAPNGGREWWPVAQLSKESR